MTQDLRITQVMDHGYVRLVDTLGTDLTVANAARVSYAKESKELTDKDRRLIRYLATHGHTSPFRHAALQFEVYAPLMVARQWWKYIVGSQHQEGIADSLNAWNESSRRYITEDPVFYVPKADEWREKPENSKQGSGPVLAEETGQVLTDELQALVKQSFALYEKAMEQGVCAEQARLFLPAYGMYVRWYWTASLQSVCHFIDQRLADDAQVEIQKYAQAVLGFVKEAFPTASEGLTEAGR
ncbi:MAG: FAD-dependent thymidylate synthase [Tissierellia bacterium]|jgi:thymidylate synthase (FAD)|nr:FAD-dependent thymidylate synthase [Bacillota bacterium]NLK58259.1 FAD-dependent thymidylate synthase [Tissierellia bacterium]